MRQGENISNLRRESQGKVPQFIVDNANPLPSGMQVAYAIVLADVTGFSASNGFLLPDSGDYPTDYPLGFEFPAGLTDLTVTTGSILCLIPV